MNRSFLRAVAIVLVPCLLADPRLFAARREPTPVSRSFSTIQPAFGQQALLLPCVEAHLAFSGAGWKVQRWLRYRRPIVWGSGIALLTILVASAHWAGALTALTAAGYLFFANVDIGESWTPNEEKFLETLGMLVDNLRGATRPGASVVLTPRPEGADLVLAAPQFGRWPFVLNHSLNWARKLGVEAKAETDGTTSTSIHLILGSKPFEQEIQNRTALQLQSDPPEQGVRLRQLIDAFNASLRPLLPSARTPGASDLGAEGMSVQPIPITPGFLNQLRARLNRRSLFNNIPVPHAWDPWDPIPGAINGIRNTLGGRIGMAENPLDAIVSLTSPTETQKRILEGSRHFLRDIPSRAIFFVEPRSALAKDFMRDVSPAKFFTGFDDEGNPYRFALVRSDLGGPLRTLAAVVHAGLQLQSHPSGQWATSFRADLYDGLGELRVRSLMARALLEAHTPFVREARQWVLQDFLGGQVSDGGKLTETFRSHYRQISLFPQAFDTVDAMAAQVGELALLDVHEQTDFTVIVQRFPQLAFVESLRIAIQKYGILLDPRETWRIAQRLIAPSEDDPLLWTYGRSIVIAWFKQDGPLDLRVFANQAAKRNKRTIFKVLDHLLKQVYERDFFDRLTRRVIRGDDEKKVIRAARRALRRMA